MMNKYDSKQFDPECEHARGGLISARKLLTSRAGSAAMVIVLAVMVLMAVEVFGGSSLLTPGTSKISAGDSFDFTLNVKSLDTDDSEAEEALSEYVISLRVSPAPAKLSVKESAGDISAVTGEYQVTSSELGGTEVLHFSIATDAGLSSETTYTVSVDVTGSVTASDSFTLVVTPAAKPDGGDDQGGGKDPDKKTPDGNGDELPDGNKMPDGSKMPSGKNMPKGNAMPSAGGTASSQASDTVTYAGSWDNYLDELSVDGYEFTNKFNKIRDTYCLSIPEEVTSLEVSAVPSDSSAVVKVTGNSDIPKGRSKIMISVTADDGSVRIYRIYVDRGEDDE